MENWSILQYWINRITNVIHADVFPFKMRHFVMQWKSKGVFRLLSKSVAKSRVQSKSNFDWCVCVSPSGNHMEWSNPFDLCTLSHNITNSHGRLSVIKVPAIKWQLEVNSQLWIGNHHTSNSPQRKWNYQIWSVNLMTILCNYNCMLPKICNHMFRFCHTIIVDQVQPTLS